MGERRRAGGRREGRTDLADLVLHVGVDDARADRNGYDVGLLAGESAAWRKWEGASQKVEERLGGERKTNRPRELSAAFEALYCSATKSASVVSRR